LDKDKSNALDIKEFENLIKRINEKISRNEIEHIFNKIDIDGSNSISF
jgi:Ca2+-binding EF-hand superfamily protein